MKITMAFFFLMFSFLGGAETCYGDKVLDGKKVYTEKLTGYVNSIKRIKEIAVNKYLKSESSKVKDEFHGLVQTNAFFNWHYLEIVRIRSQVRGFMDDSYKLVVIKKLILLDEQVREYKKNVRKVSGKLNLLQNLILNNAPESSLSRVRKEIEAFENMKNIKNIVITCVKPKLKISFVEKKGGRFYELEKSEVIYKQQYHLQLKFFKKPDDLGKTAKLKYDGKIKELELVKTDANLIFRTHSFFFSKRSSDGGVIVENETEIIGAFNGYQVKKITPVNTGAVIRYRFYYNKRLSSDYRNRWRKQIEWWVKRINKNCKSINIDKVAKELTPDFKYLMFYSDRGRKKRIIKFASESSDRPRILKKRWIKGLDGLKYNIYKRLSPKRSSAKVKKIDASFRTFHIAVFNDVRDTNSGGEDVSRPGIVHLKSNIGAMRFSGTTPKHRQHELGHYFGLKDDSGGIMDKFPASSPGNNGKYGDEAKTGWKVKSVREDRCAQVKSHLSL
jgi:hypothetical protein